MNQELLEARKAEAVQQKDQALAMANMAQGVIADCDYWLTQLALVAMVKADPEPQAES